MGKRETQGWGFLSSELLIVSPRQPMLREGLLCSSFLLYNFLLENQFLFLGEEPSAWSLEAFPGLKPEGLKVALKVPFPH